MCESDKGRASGDDDRGGGLGEARAEGARQQVDEERERVLVFRFQRAEMRHAAEGIELALVLLRVFNLGKQAACG